MDHLRIAADSFAFERASLVAYHCAADEADWNLELVRDGRTLWLSGTVTPGPRTADALDGAVATLDPRSLDELVEALLGRPATLFLDGPTPDLSFPLARTERGVRFTARFACGWDRALATFDASAPIDVAIDIDAAIASLHASGLP